MMIHVLQGERELISDCRSLARFELRGIPPMVAGAAKIRVTFQVDADGLLSVSARELASGVEASIQVKPSYGLTDGEIARMLEDSFRKADQDRDARALREHLVDAQRLLEAVEAALIADGNVCFPPRRAAIEAQMAELRALLDSQDVSAIERQTKRLSQITDAFAARRLDSTVKAALAGRRLNDIELTQMPQIIFLPNADHCPEGAVIDAKTGETVLDAALRGIDIEHACESPAHAPPVTWWFARLPVAQASDELEDDMLDKAWGWSPTRGCPVRR